MIKVSVKDEKASVVADQVYDLLWSEQGLRTTTADIEIDAMEGLVALNGRVRTHTQRRQAEQLARAGLDGWQLRNNLIADDQLAIDLAGRLAADPRTATANVRIDAYLGVVYLRGAVHGAEQRAAVVELVGQSPNVLKVEDNLAIVR